MNAPPPSVESNRTADAGPLPAWRVLVPAGVAEVALLAALGWWSAADTPAVRTALFFAAFGVYAWAASRVRDRVGGTAVIWGVAILARLVLFPLPPELSGEVYRYLWDGVVQLGQINPYRYAPSDPALAHLHTAWHALLEHPDTITPYPPLAQWAFLALAVAGGAVFQAKLLWLGFDLGTAWLLGRVAHITGRSRRLTQLLWLWSPLLLVEVAWNAHLEPLALFPMVLFVLLARSPVGSATAAVLGGLVRPVVFLALPAGTRRLGLRFGAAAAGVLAAVHLPYVAAGVSPYGGALASLWSGQFMAGPFLLLESGLPGQAPARWAALACVLGVVVWTVGARFRPERALLWTVGAALLFTPVLRPWFALWILPVAALRLSLPWLAFTGLAYLGYWGVEGYQLGGEWAQPLWLRLALWLPFLALLAREADRYWNTRVPLPSAVPVSGPPRPPSS